MEIRAFAESILFNSSLTTKLEQPDILTDLDPKSRRAEPDFPARAAALNFRDRQFQSQKYFPGKAKLTDSIARAHVLHFFANHELLAMEIMALTLLRFPDAPASFRKGVAETIREEQQHLTMYVDRMRELGADFGDIPVNGYFWSVFKQMKSPKDFVAQMSLTFEQANLDYSRHYANEFRKYDDIKSSDILERVLADEIGHVKHGLIWFNQWRENDDSLWKEFKDALPSPLSPARAKGIGFDIESRRRAGIPEDFINELRVFSQSKSKPPVLYFFNPSFETNLTSDEWKERPIESASAVDHIQTDLSSLISILANPTDSVFVKKKPTSQHLLDLQSFGIRSCEFVDHSDLQNSPRKFDRIVPWGFCPEFREFQQHLKDNLQNIQEVDLEIIRKISSKTFGATVQQKFKNELWLKHLDRVVITSSKDLHSELERRFGDIEKVVLKSPYSSSGRSQIRILKSEWISKSEDKKWQPWVQREIAKSGSIILENWLERVCDLSALGQVSLDGVIKNLGVTRPICDRRGQYLGHFLGRKFSDLEPKALQFWHQTGRKVADDSFVIISEFLRENGFSGPFGIDMFVYQINSEYFLLPLVEINPRLTMGRIALELDRHIVPSQTGIFGIVPKASKFAENISQVFEDQFFEQPGFRQIKNGFRFLNDPTNSILVNSFLAVAESHSAVLENLNKLLPTANPFKDITKK